MLLLLASLTLSATATPPDSAWTAPGTSIYQITSTWTTQDEATVQLKDFRGQPQMIALIYTHCGYACPMIVQNMKQVLRELSDDEQSHVGRILVTMDPERDTPEVVGRFAENMHPRMIGLTGSPEQVAAASQAYKTYYKSHDDGSDDFYVVDHSTFTYLVMPDHGFVDFFRRELGPAELADRVACYVEAA